MKRNLPLPTRNVFAGCGADSVETDVLALADPSDGTVLAASDKCSKRVRLIQDP